MNYGDLTQLSKGLKQKSKKLQDEQMIYLISDEKHPEQRSAVVSYANPKLTLSDQFAKVAVAEVERFINIFIESLKDPEVGRQVRTERLKPIMESAHELYGSIEDDEIRTKYDQMLETMDKSDQDQVCDLYRLVANAEPDLPEEIDYTLDVPLTLENFSVYMRKYRDLIVQACHDKGHYNVFVQQVKIRGLTKTMDDAKRLVESIVKRYIPEEPVDVAIIPVGVWSSVGPATETDIDWTIWQVGEEYRKSYHDLKRRAHEAKCLKNPDLDASFPEYVPREFDPSVVLEKDSVPLKHQYAVISYRIMDWQGHYDYYKTALPGFVTSLLQTNFNIKVEKSEICPELNIEPEPRRVPCIKVTGAYKTLAQAETAAEAVMKRTKDVFADALVVKMRKWVLYDPSPFDNIKGRGMSEREQEFIDAREGAADSLENMKHEIEMNNVPFTVQEARV